MFKYKTSDIIKRAATVADLNNSKFIGYEENINLLNENYTALYQKLSNKGDKTFLKTIETTGDSVKLPSDFYALAGVYLWVNKTVRPVLRKADTEGEYGLFYEIVGDKIQFYGTSYGTVKISYYPKPMTLTYPAECKKITGLPETYNTHALTCIYIFGSLALMVTDDDYYGVYSIAKKEWVYEPTVSFLGIMYAKGPFIYEQNGIRIMGASFDSLITLPADFTKGIFGSRPSCFDPTTREIATLMGIQWVYSSSYKVPEWVTDAMSLYTEDMKNFYALTFVDDQSVLLYNGEKVDLPYPTEEIGICLKNGILSVATNGMVFQVEEGKVCGQMDIQRNQNLATLLGPYDGDFGFAWLYKDYTGDLWTCPCYTDIELEVPSNFYFNIMAYYMAYAYKARQHSDTTQLSAQIEQQEATFFDTLSNDDYGPVRINHVY